MKQPLLNPARQALETFDNYCKRRKDGNARVHARLKYGVYFYRHKDPVPSKRLNGAITFHYPTPMVPYRRVDYPETSV